MESLSDQQQFLVTLEEALRQRVCSVCVDRNIEGPCEANARHECTLFENLPQLARSIAGVHSDKMDDYIAALRENVCSVCLYQRLDGTCQEREEVRCSLDRYLLPIIETIEEVRGVALKPGDHSGES
jgi:hypothetical protein